ncbi:MAG: hypothetical protein ACLSBD_12820 [Blautia massiliensis (ex Durand et al. 2017)]
MEKSTRSFENSTPKNSVDVLQTVFEAKLIPIPAKIDGYYDLYLNAPETMYSGADVTIKDFWT